MKRRSRIFSIATLAALLVGACSGSGSTTGDTTTAISTTSGTSQSTTTIVTILPPSSTADPPMTTSTISTTTTTEPGAPPVAEADGWRLLITEPKSGGEIGSAQRICYEATGTSREPVLALDVRLIERGSMSVVVETRLDISVGRGEVEVDLSGGEDERYDLSIGLVVNGESSDGLVVRVLDVVLADGSAAALCE